MVFGTHGFFGRPQAVRFFWNSPPQAKKIRVYTLYIIERKTLFLTFHRRKACCSFKGGTPGYSAYEKKIPIFFRGRNFCSRSNFSLYFVLNQKYCSREVVCACFLWSGVTSDPSLTHSDLGTSLRKLPDISAFWMIYAQITVHHL